MSNAVTSGVASLGPTAPCGVGGGSMRCGGAGGGAVCVTTEGGDVTTVMGIEAGVVAAASGLSTRGVGSCGEELCALAGAINVERMASATRLAVKAAQALLGRYFTGPV